MTSLDFTYKELYRIEASPPEGWGTCCTSPQACHLTSNGLRADILSFIIGETLPRGKGEMIIEDSNVMCNVAFLLLIFVNSEQHNYNARRPVTG